VSVRGDVLDRFHRLLVEEIARKRPEYLSGPFTVAEIYQNLVPYGTHRDRLGVEINGDYEDALLRLLAGEGGYLILESEHALRELRRELKSSNPNTGVYREYAAVDVRLAAEHVPEGALAAVARAEANLVEGAPEPAPNGRHVPVDAPAPHQPPRLAVPPEEEPLEASGEEWEPATTPDEHACRWCRASLPDREDLRFCPYCGTDVHAVPCATCGQEIEPDWRFCIACGTEVPR